MPVDPYEAVFFEHDAPRIEVQVMGESTPLKENIQAILDPIREKYFGIIFGFRRHHLCCQWSAGIMAKFLAHSLPGHDVRIGFGFPPVEPARVFFHYWTEVDDVAFVDACHGPMVGLPRHKLYVGDISALKEKFARYDRTKPMAEQPRASGYGEKSFEKFADICDELRNRPSTIPAEWKCYEQRQLEIDYTYRMLQALMQSGSDR